MNRRRFITLLSVSGLTVAGIRFWPEQGLWNPCLKQPVPQTLLQHEVVQAAWEGIDPALMWDCHVHLVGTGDSGSGIWVNPEMESLLHPIQFTQFKFYLNSSCTDEAENVDDEFIARLRLLQLGLHPDSRFMLLAFDYRYDENGVLDKQKSQFYVPNAYAAKVHQTYPETFEWIASIHPYREDSVETLEWAVANGARAIKWLPGAMGMDPSSKRCDRFYDALKKHNMPLLSHAGAEYAVGVAETRHLNHPLLLRYPLDQGVKVIIAHCASLGSGPDLDIGPKGKKHRFIEFFSRLMADKNYQDLLFADISAITQVTRKLDTIKTIFEHDEWHGRLINGSDYPLPGVMPLFSLSRYVKAGYLQGGEVELLSQIRRYNPLLFDFVLKRSLIINGHKLADRVFETAQLFSKMD